jgi:hypothetical protein
MCRKRALKKLRISGIAHVSILQEPLPAARLLPLNQPLPAA